METPVKHSISIVPARARANELPPAPKRLSAEAAELWRTYTNAWALDEHSLVMLELAMETFDRLRQAQRAIKRRGLVLKNGRVNPACLVERDSRRDLAKMLKSLGLTLDPSVPGRA